MSHGDEPHGTHEMEALIEREFPVKPMPSDLVSLTVALATPMRRVKELRATMAANQAAYEAEQKRLAEAHAAVMQKDQSVLDHFLAEVERLGRMRLEYESDRKSVILLFGQIGTRRQPTKVEVTDERALMAAGDEMGFLVPWNPGPRPPAPTVNKAALLKLMEQYGKTLPGVSLVLGEDAFFFDDSVTDTHKMEEGE